MNLQKKAPHQKDEWESSCDESSQHVGDLEVYHTPPKTQAAQEQTQELKANQQNDLLSHVRSSEDYNAINSSCTSFFFTATRAQNENNQINQATQ